MGSKAVRARRFQRNGRHSSLVIFLAELTLYGREPHDLSTIHMDYRPHRDQFAYAGDRRRGGDGQLAFNNVCRTCHTLKEGDNRLGPSLHKIIGRKAGSLPNYSYSNAMKGADLVWDRATLDRFISNPDQVVPGNNMKPYGGLASAEERAKIIAFLEANEGS
jgi:cytochrome c